MYLFPELVKEGLVGLGTKTAQHGRLIQSAGSKRGGVNVAVTDALIVGQIYLSVLRRLVRVGDVLRDLHAQQPLRVPLELLPDAQRENDQSLAAVVLHAQPDELKPLGRLSEAEGFKQRPSPPLAGPHHRVPLMRFQRSADLTWFHIEAGLRRDNDL